MKVKHLVLAVIGAAALSGCQNEVMGNRGYVPVPSPDNPAPMTAETQAAPESQNVGTPVQPSEPAPAPAEKAAAPRFQPMTGVVSSGGVDSTKGAAKPGRKAAAAEAAPEGGVYVVQAGDFPEKIARKLHVRLGDLMKANNLTAESAKRLRVGQKLTIPGKSAAPAKVSGKKAAGKGGKAAGNDKPAAAEVKDGIYVVQPGDFPEKIARKLHVKLGDLMKANDLTPEKASRLQIGQKLIVPGKTAAAPAKAEAKNAKKTAAPAKKQNGDSAELAKTLNEAAEAPVTTAPAAAPAAPAAESEVSAPHPANGEIVVNTESHVVVVEDNEVSVEEFARRNNTTVDTLRKLNPDLKPDTTSFKKNEVVFVPGAGK